LTTVEIVLALAVAALAAQIVILQRHYTDKLAEHADLLNDLIDLLETNRPEAKCLNRIKEKIFNSSQ
jgi:hypothetical protein